VLRPFNHEVFLRDVALQLEKGIQDDTAVMKIQELEVELAWLLETQNCLVVLDHISSHHEYDLIIRCLNYVGRIIVITREKDIAQYCTAQLENIYRLEGLEFYASLDLFINKVLL
jgi:hypothetical protein